MSSTVTDVRTRPLSGHDLGHLLAFREHVRDEIVRVPRAVRREVLAALETARQGGRAQPWTPPSMTGGELMREIKWRLDVSSYAEARAAAAVLERLRHTTPAGTRRRPGGRN